MFKKVSVGVLVVVVLALVVAGAVFAQESFPPTDGVCPYGETCGGYGYGMGGFGYHGTMPTILADALGMTSEELYEALSAGQTIAELAEAQGVSLDDLVDALIAPRVEQLEQAVADGYMAQEQADEMIAQMTEHMAYRLKDFGLGYGGQGSYGRGGCGMMGGSTYGGRQGDGMGGRWGNNSAAPRSSWQAPLSTDL
ncbi:MAG: hypothetical protein GY832_27580 [Chloroflexi bacterium]|nr:hypothetical protein [Chloroflexota bacterium]